MTRPNNSHCIAWQHGSVFALAVIAPCLVMQFIALACLATVAAFAINGADFVDSVPLIPTRFFGLINRLTGSEYACFRELVIVTCSSGLSGAVFMVRELYINFCYGRKVVDDKNVKDEQGHSRVIWYLGDREIPRYLLLPLSACVLGPINLALLRLGLASVTSSNNDITGQLPLPIVIGFVSGFCYHDSLNYLAQWSESLLNGKREKKTSSNDFPSN